MTPILSVANPAVVNNDPSAEAEKVQPKPTLGEQLVLGAIGGFCGYLLSRGINYIGIFGKTDSPIRPMPYVLAGVLCAALVISVRLTYLAALKVIGNPEDFNSKDPKKLSCSEGIRKRMWQVGCRVKKIEHSVDVIFSKIFHVRTGKEIKDNKIPDLELDNMEIIRRAFCEQMEETFTSTLPYNLAVKIVTSAGHVIPGGQIFELSGMVLFGVIGFMKKAQDIFMKIKQDEMEAAKAIAKKAKQEVDPKVSNDPQLQQTVSAAA